MAHLASGLNHETGRVVHAPIVMPHRSIASNDGHLPEPFVDPHARVNPSTSSRNEKGTIPTRSFLQHEDVNDGKPNDGAYASHRQPRVMDGLDIVRR